MFQRLLIANRGEIACRIIRTAHRLGIETIAVYSDADTDALHVRSADRAVHIGAAAARDSYLRSDAILAAAAATDAQAIHPGYGFLSENADFAAACINAGRTFVGPSADAIRSMGSKIGAKRIVSAAGAPVIPGYFGDQDPNRLAREAEQIGYPLLIKASAGGGGRGMRVVRSAAEFATALIAARREAKAAFGDEDVLLEKYLTTPKHIEIQVLADAHGNTLHLFERDCSVQRRHQKVIEEAPGATISEVLRREMGAAAVKAASAVGYTGAGTVEFIVEDGAFYFLEMNTRLQVEHPVTEAIVGLDLVEWQLRIAAGEKLPFRQTDLQISGHAIEARLYAENPRRKFLPSIGRLVHVRFSTDVRVDTGVATGSHVSMHYDPMIAKVIAHGATRTEAIGKLDRALGATEIAGVEHNTAFLRRVLADPAFRAGDYDTGLIDAGGAQLIPAADDRYDRVAALLFAERRASASAWQRGDAFRVNLPHRQVVRFERGGELRQVGIDGLEVLANVSDAQGEFNAEVNGERVRGAYVFDGSTLYLMCGGGTVRFNEVETDVAHVAADIDGDGRVCSPMPGQIIAIHVRLGDAVKRNQAVMVLEAMKMEHVILAPLTGRVDRLPVALGDRVDDGAELVVIART
jgi:3-methylcrotonyl-CoA carboxylase alpha subunit